jgi:hypothetical protein
VHTTQRALMLTTSYSVSKYDIPPSALQNCKGPSWHREHGQRHRVGIHKRKPLHKLPMGHAEKWARHQVQQPISLLQVALRTCPHRGGLGCPQNLHQAAYELARPCRPPRLPTHAKHPLKPRARDIQARHRAHTLRQSPLPPQWPRQLLPCCPEGQAGQTPPNLLHACRLHPAVPP